MFRVRYVRFTFFLAALPPVLLIAGCGTGGPENNVQVPTTPASHSVEDLTPDSPDSAIDIPIQFEDVSGTTGIQFVHVSGDCREKPFPAANGSGVAALDLDLDGWTDLLFLNGTTFPMTDAPDGPHDQCYKNVGRWSFRNVTSQTGLGSTGYSAGVACGDFNADGFPDAFVNCVGRNRFYINCGDGTFTDVTDEAAVGDPSWGTSAATLDFDGDGDLDLYACNYGEWDWATNAFCGDREKDIRIFCSPRTIKAVPDRLFENLGNGQFRDVLSTAGIDREPGRGQGVIAADIDNDHLTDLYIGNDINPNSLFRNRGDGTFDDMTDLTGTAVDFAGQNQAGMGVDIADVDRDGLVELFVTNYEGEHNTFYRNLGNNIFQDFSQSSGIAAQSMKWVGWGISFTDLNADGWKDLVVTNGHTDDNLQSLGRDGMYEQPPLLYFNRGGRLETVKSPRNSYFERRHPGRALVATDLDRDLLPDLVFGHKDAKPAILKNRSPTMDPESQRVVEITFVGVTANRDGVGVTVSTTGIPPVNRDQVKSGGSYLSSRPGFLTLCLNPEEEGSLSVQWPNGHLQNVIVPIDSGRYVIVEGRPAIGVSHE